LLHQEIDNAAFLMPNPSQPLRQQRTTLGDFKIGFEFLPKQGIILEGILLGILFDEKIKGIDHGHFGDQVNPDFQFTHRLRKDRSRNPVAKWVLLPIKVVIGGRYGQPIVMNRSACVGCRSQANQVGRQRCVAVKLVACNVVYANMYCHVFGCSIELFET
jgi:hypothetical protein